MADSSPYDTNLSFGEMYAGDNAANVGIHATDDNNKSDPLYGGSPYLTFYSANYNQIYDAIISDPVTPQHVAPPHAHADGPVPPTAGHPLLRPYDRDQARRTCG